MRELLWDVGELNPGEFWVEDLSTQTQVGWITQSKNDGQWFIRDMSYTELGGPFPTKQKAMETIEELLANEFGVGSPAS